MSVVEFKARTGRPAWRSELTLLSDIERQTMPEL